MPQTRPKIEPTVLRYASMAELPPIDELVRLAETNDWVIFEVPTQETVDADGKRQDPTIAERDQIARDLMPRLPGHDVQTGWNILDEAFMFPARKTPFVTGQIVEAWGRFSTRRKMSLQSVDDSLDLFLVAVSEYEEIIDALMARLARQLGVDVSSFSRDTAWHDHKQTGRLEAEPGGLGTGTVADEWNYFFHGYECAFGNRKTGVGIEARMGFGVVCDNTFAILDPYFFLQFINTTEAFAPLADALRDNFSDTVQALEHVEQLGFLREVKSERGGGWLLSDAGRERVREVQAAETRNNA